MILKDPPNTSNENSHEGDPQDATESPDPMALPDSLTTLNGLLRSFYLCARTKVFDQPCSGGDYVTLLDSLSDILEELCSALLDLLLLPVVNEAVIAEGRSNSFLGLDKGGAQRAAGSSLDEEEGDDVNSSPDDEYSATRDARDGLAVQALTVVQALFRFGEEAAIFWWGVVWFFVIGVLMGV